MKPFYRDSMTAEEYSRRYIGKKMSEIQEAEEERFESNKAEIDEAHSSYAPDRTRMLTVKKLIDFLKTQDQDACVLAYEPNSDAYIEQFPDLPSPDICSVKDAKSRLRKDLENWYGDHPDAEDKVNRDINTVFRYAEDSDIIIAFK